MTLQVAQRLVDRLARLERRIVLAESCTGGLVSAELAKIPGVSDWLCGSAVTYRCDTKVQWLGVERSDIDAHTAVSKEVTGQMARGALRKTPEASLSAAITGHLGPAAPHGFDGVVFVAVAARCDDDIAIAGLWQKQLKTKQREERQAESAAMVLELILVELS